MRVIPTLNWANFVRGRIVLNFACVLVQYHVTGLLVYSLFHRQQKNPNFQRGTLWKQQFSEKFQHTALEFLIFYRSILGIQRQTQSPIFQVLTVHSASPAITSSIDPWEYKGIRLRAIRNHTAYSLFDNSEKWRSANANSTRAVPGSHHRIPAYIEFFYDDDTQGLPYRVTPAGILSSSFSSFFFFSIVKRDLKHFEST